MGALQSTTTDAISRIIILSLLYKVESISSRVCLGLTKGGFSVRCSRRLASLWCFRGCKMQSPKIPYHEQIVRRIQLSRHPFQLCIYKLTRRSALPQFGGSQRETTASSHHYSVACTCPLSSRVTPPCCLHSV